MDGACDWHGNPKGLDGPSELMTKVAVHLQEAKQQLRLERAGEGGPDFARR
jgi:hypothetical protein